MTSRIEPHRVSAYNTSKQSENKMHDDTVAKRYGFIGGLVPGVDVMAYMMHLPVAKWGRAFLERGLIEARFVKPVYDGELADVTGEERRFGFSGGLVPGVDVMAYMMHQPVAKWGRAFLERGLIDARFVKPVYDGEMAELDGRGEQRRACDRGRQPRRALRDRHGVVAGGAPACFACRLSRSRGGSRAQAGQCRFLRTRQMARHRAARPGRRMRPRNIWRISAKPSRSTRRRASAIPACCSG